MSAEHRVWTTTTKLVVISIVLVVVGFALYRFSAAIPPIAVAVILAYILTPLVNTIQDRLHLHRVVAILLVYLVMLLVITAILMLVIPRLGIQVKVFTGDLEGIIRRVPDWLGSQVILAGIPINGSDLATRLANTLESAVQPILGQTLDVVTSFFEVVVWVVFIVVISIYLIKDSDKLTVWLHSLPPLQYRPDFQHLTWEINTIWGSFFRGQLLLVLVVSIIITIEGLVIGLHFSLLLGILAGLLEFLPSVGHAIFFLIVSLVALLGGSHWLPLPNWAFWVLVACLHILYTQFDVNYLIPRIIGRSVRLPPLVIVLGIIVGASLAGVLGIFLAAPTIASLRVLGKYIYARLLDLDPFPPESPTQPLPPLPNLKFWKRKARE